MSTENIREEAEVAIEALDRLAEAARKRDADIAHEREALRQKRANVVVGARAAMRHVDDKDNALVEEQGQYCEMVEGETVEEEQPAPPPPPPPAEPAPAPATTEPNALVGLANWVRDFTVLQWVLAIAGALAGLLVGTQTHDFGENLPGVVDGLVSVVWVVGLVVLGFGLGGLLGSLFSRETPEE